MKLAIVTGASSGIGADAARHLASNGYRVILVARRKDRLDQVASLIGDLAVIEVCDAASGDQVMAMADRICRQHGVPDVIVNCAGAGQWKRIEQTSAADALTMIQAPYLSAFHVTQAFMDKMMTRGSGVIIHVNSPACFFPWPSSVGYSSSRWALRGLHESLCQDLAGTGVSSCHVVFGRVNSPYFENNPGVTKVLPTISNLVRTLSTDECGRTIAQLATRPRREVISPGMLRLFVWIHWAVPSLVLWLLRVTGAGRQSR